LASNVQQRSKFKKRKKTARRFNVLVDQTNMVFIQHHQTMKDLPLNSRLFVL